MFAAFDVGLSLLFPLKPLPRPPDSLSPKFAILPLVPSFDVKFLKFATYPRDIVPQLPEKRLVTAAAPQSETHAPIASFFAPASKPTVKLFTLFTIVGNPKSCGDEQNVISFADLAASFLFLFD